MWKRLYYGTCITIVVILIAIVWLVTLSEKAAREELAKAINKPVTVHVIVHYQPIETTHLTQWVGEVAVETVRQGRRSQPGEKLSPEMQRKVNEAEQWRMTWPRNKAILDGPPGLDAPWKRPLN